MHRELTDALGQINSDTSLKSKIKKFVYQNNNKEKKTS